ncbi:MAG: beta-lactamase family protein [Anaerolineaceae bacterium]|nr:beta-lactamase family protein [Anaerolineaceae bacterium]
MQTTIQPEEAGFSSERLARIPAVMQGYIDRKETGGILTLIERKGEIVHTSKCGYQDLRTQTPIAADSLFRIYSMTKPIVSMGLMMLFEEARFHLNDPVQLYLPEFRDVKVWEADGQLSVPKTAPTIGQLLSHTAGLTYGVFGETEVDKQYQAANLWQPGIDLQEMVRRIAGLPLICHPGERWVYSVSTDVLGRLVEVLSGKRLDAYLQEKVFAPLGMEDTSFSVPDEKVERLTTCYVETEKEKIVVFDSVEKSAFRDVSLFSGGGGLVSTLKDYLQFVRLVLGKGALDDVRLIGRKTFDLMAGNHIPQGLLPFMSPEPALGMGFGLGFSVIMDAVQTGKPGSVGTLGWGGMASTVFWVDPQEELIAILMTQLVPMDRLRLEDDFRTLVYQAMID